MSEVVTERPAPQARVPARAAAVAWQAIRAAAVPAARRRPVEFEPRVERVEQRVEDQPVGDEARLPQPPRGGVSVGVVEAVVLLATAAFFVAGLVGALVS